MKSKILKTRKQIIITQLLSIIFAISAEIHLRFLITYDWLFTNIILLNLEIILLIIMYAILINLLLEGKWRNVVLISVSYVIYWFIIFIKGSEFFPAHTDPNDYGVGIMGIFISIYQWISVIIASIVGTYLNKRKNNLKINL